MASKEATVYIIDVGSPMGESSNGREQSNLDWSMEYVWDKITTTVSSGRKTAMMGVIALRTDTTKVDGLVEDPDEYSNITILQPIKQFLLEDIRNLQQQIKPSRTNEGDAISAIVLAIPMIEPLLKGKTGNRLKVDARIVVVTDGTGHIDADDEQLGQIAKKLKQEQIELTVLGVDFDDPDYGFKEEEKDEEKDANESLLKTLVDKVDGTFSNIAPAVESSRVPRLKDHRPYASYKGILTLGDPEKYETAISIDIERYTRIQVAKPPTASSHVVKTDLGGGQSGTQSTTTVVGDGDEAQSNGQLAAVRNQRVYQVDDEDNPGAKKNIEEDELSKGFEYGRTAVPISASESNIVDLEGPPRLDIIGFVPEEKFDRYLPMSRSSAIIAQKTNEKANLALSSFIHALYEAESYAIARLVQKENKRPVLILLAPLIQPDVECLIDVEVPFAEDIRGYRFPPLDRKVTVAGKTLVEHRDIPKADLMEAMSEYVDAMDVSTLGRDEDGNPSEYMPMDETYSPLVHRVNQIIAWRATDPFSSKLPDPPLVLLKYSHPPSDLTGKVSSLLNAVKKAGDIKRVPPKQKGRKRTREREKPLSGLNVDELLGDGGRQKRIKIDPQNAVPTFKQALAITDDVSKIKEAADSMGDVVYSYITDSIGESAYSRALECIRVMKEELIDFEEPGIFNDFIRKLKGDILSKKLGGERREMWWLIKKNRVGLIDKRHSPVSDVDEEEAEDFLKKMG